MITLANFNLEAVLVAVAEVFLALAHLHLHERNIRAMTLDQVAAVLTIFVAVPFVIVAAVAIVVAGFTTMIFRIRRSNDMRHFSILGGLVLAAMVIAPLADPGTPRATRDRYGHWRLVQALDGISPGDPTRSPQMPFVEQQNVRRQKGVCGCMSGDGFADSAAAKQRPSIEESR